jgi:hypothetical protein
MPAYFPSRKTQMYLSPNFTKHSYTRSNGDLISSATGAYFKGHSISKLVFRVFLDPNY